MKRHIYNKVISVAMLASGLAFTACQDDDFVQYTAFEVGEEIRFCASAAQDGSATTRTVYGETGTIGGVEYIALNWEVGDKMEIVSPQAALSGGTGKAVYAIDDPNISEGFNGETEGHSNASMLKKEGESGLQWGVGYTKDVNGSGAIDAKLEEGWHDFYALYPSSNSFTSEAEGHVALDLIQVNDEVRPTATGYMPIVQKPNVKKGDGDGISEEVSEDGKNTIYTIHPDMRYAYMVATTQTSRYKEVNEDDPPIQLEFKPVTTALQFEITANEIDEINGSELTITSIQLTTAPGVTKNICGYFTCDYLSGQMYAQNDNETYNRIYLDISGAKKPITLKRGDKCDVTFFVLPTQDFKAGDLQLQIFFTLNGSPQVRTATINRPLVKMKKYHFKDLQMPPFTTKVTGSTWFSALDNQALLSQVSIPVAGNVFANNQYVDGALVQQVADYEALWDMGVRGFEFVNRSRRDESKNPKISNDYSIAEEHFVCAEDVLSGTPTFHTAFNTLVSKYYENKQTMQEALVILCTYLPGTAKTTNGDNVGYDGYDPQRYVYNLLNYLRDYTTPGNDYYNTFGITKDHFVQINSHSIVADIKGKIAIIIRPGDDDRWDSSTSGTNTAAIKLTTSAGNDWSNNVVLIQDWGTAYDVWDRRYDGFARESTFETEYVKGARPQVENYLWGISKNGNDSFTPFGFTGNNDFCNGVAGTSFDTEVKPKALDEFQFKHAVTGGSFANAYVQEWCRVVKENTGYWSTGLNGYVGTILTGGSVTGHLVVNWPESLSEKKEAIKDLFEHSVNRVEGENNIYINVLSGYYVSKDYNKSYLPFKKTFSSQVRDVTIGDEVVDITPSGQGKGGDFVGLAYDLNEYTYNLLSATPGPNTAGALSKQGPWGLVVMDHIGNTAGGTNDKSIDLVNLIMMNNFKFPLITEGDGDSNGDTPNPPATTDAAVSFSNEPANPSGAIH